MRRITWLTSDAEAMADFYCDVFGMRRWYEHKLHVDHRFPPTGLADQAPARLIICQAEDPAIGMLGFLQFEALDAKPVMRPRLLSNGDFVLVWNTDDVQGLTVRAEAAGGRLATPPAVWEVPAQDGSGMKRLLMAGLFDPEGRYCEISQTL
jgi:catechol 2,3-dioxygenase-like lactoylglutathione lyase family enzyme